MGVEKNTIIWYCSDNGGSKNISPSTVGGLRGNKNTMWEGGLRVPAIIEWPETIAPGITKYPASTMDIFPTILEIVGLYPNNKYSNLDGKSITNLFEANKHKRTLKKLSSHLGFLIERTRRAEGTIFRRVSVR